MPAAGNIRGSGQKFRTCSDIMTAAGVVTGELARDQVNPTTDRYSYFRFPGASFTGLTTCRPAAYWPVPAPVPDLP